MSYGITLQGGGGGVDMTYLRFQELMQNKWRVASVFPGKHLPIETTIETTYVYHDSRKDRSMITIISSYLHNSLSINKL